MMIECACKDCNDRYAGCHSSCEKYADFKKKKDELHEQKTKATNYGNLYYSYKKRVIEDMLRKTHREKK